MAGLISRNADYRVTSNPRIDGRPHLVFPSEAHYKSDPLDTVLLTTKRSLRERWRQIASPTVGQKIYLGTINDQTSISDLSEMMGRSIHLVVPARIKADIHSYNTSTNVLSYESFLSIRLDPAYKKWKKDGVVAP